MASRLSPATDGGGGSSPAGACRWRVCANALVVTANATTKMADLAKFPGMARLLAGRAADSKFLDPGPQLDFRGPGAAVLPQQVEIILRDRIRSEHAVGPVGRFGAACAADSAVDHEMGYVNTLRR